MRIPGTLRTAVRMFIMIFIDHSLAYMHIRGAYKKYTRVGDFDTPTHQPTKVNVKF